MMQRHQTLLDGETDRLLYNSGVMALFGGKPPEGLKPGWRDLRWGDPPTPAMSLVHEGGEDATYTADGEEMNLEGATLDRILYVFYQGRFSDLVVEVPPASAERVFKALVGRWGKPTQPNAFIEDFHWENRSHGVEATIATFSKNPNTKAATLAIQSKYIKAKRAIAHGKAPGKL